jgi:hypothetical protein
VLAVRTTTHKLITYPGHDEWTEVFDLEKDPYELKNLVADKRLLARLRKEFDALAQSVEFQMPKLPAENDAPRRSAPRAAAPTNSQ